MLTRAQFLLSLIVPLVTTLVPSRYLCTWCGSLLKCHAGPRSCPDAAWKYSFQSKDPQWEWCSNEKCGWWEALPTRHEFEAEKESL